LLREEEGAGGGSARDGKGTRGEGRGKEYVTDKLTPRDRRGKGKRKILAVRALLPCKLKIRKRIKKNQTVGVALNSSRKSNFSCSVCGP